MPSGAGTRQHRVRSRLRVGCAVMRVQQRAFPAHVDSLRPVRAWAGQVLTRAGATEEPRAHAVLLLHELTTHTLDRLTPAHTQGAQIGVFIRTGIGTIAVGTVCETHRLQPAPTQDLLRHYRHTLLDTLADDHGSTRDDVLYTHYAELRWHAPALTGATPTPRLPDIQRGLSVQPRTGPPPAGPTLN